jgi:glutamate dehydrogenase/leucine dehydrogenase
MFNSVLESVQNAQKTFVNTFVTNEEIARPMIRMIDSQCETAKLTAKAIMDITTTLTAAATEKVHETMKFDFTKFADAFKPVTETAKK